MPDLPELPELLRTPLPDAAHDDLRVAILAALEQVAEQIQRIDDAFLLLLSTADFAQSTLNTTIAGQVAIGQAQQQAAALPALLSAVGIRIDAVNVRAGTALANADALQIAVADLAARVDALQPTPPPTTPTTPTEA